MSVLAALLKDDRQIMFWNESVNPDHEQYKVLIERDKLIDTARDDRPIKIKVYYPSNYEGEKLPIILWSHGLGGSVDGAAFLSRYIAANGFIIVHVQHHGTDSSLWEGQKEHPWDIIRRTHISRETTLNRYKDVPFVLDALSEWFDKHPQIKAIADMSNLGMSGHSFGALTTQVMAGMLFPNEESDLIDLSDDRFKAGILYSPGSVEHLGDFDPNTVYPPIKTPLFHMTGTEDGSPLSGQGYEMRLAVYNHTKKEKYLLVLNNGDHMVFNGSRGKLGQSEFREQHEEIIKVMALSFWEAKLKNNQAAQEWLTGEGAKAYLREKAEYSHEKRN
ncbi:MAG: hypothetical protein AAF988_00330 [Pseudomonadota bacterium]